MNQTPHAATGRRMAGLFLGLLLCYPVDALSGIYRWQDTTGITHYGDSPPVTSHYLTKLHPTAYDSAGQVASVIDGDTLALTDGRRVRLLGINTPEVAHHGRPGEPLGEQAKQFLKTQVEGKRIRLYYDLQHRDHYQRLLARVFLEDGREINALLLQHGMAHALLKWPNLKNAEHYYALEREAREVGRGIWSLSAYQVKSLDDLAAQQNRFTRLHGRVTEVKHSSRYSYLLFSGKLRVAVKQAHLPLFKKAGIAIDSLQDHRLVLRGWLSRRHGTPYLELEHPFQLERID